MNEDCGIDGVDIEQKYSNRHKYQACQRLKTCSDILQSLPKVLGPEIRTAPSAPGSAQYIMNIFKMSAKVLSGLNINE